MALSSTARVVTSLLVMGGVALILPAQFRPGARLLVSWNTGVLTFLTLVVVAIAGLSADEVRTRSQYDREGRYRVLITTLLISLMSLGAVAYLLVSIRRHDRWFHIEMLLSVVSVFNAWLLLQTAFAIYYARYYYQPAPGSDSVRGGLQFAGEQQPDYWDFLYFSFAIGTSYSTSDTSIESRTLRRIVLLQSIVSFLFFTILIGLVMSALGTLF